MKEGRKQTEEIPNRNSWSFFQAPMLVRVSLRPAPHIMPEVSAATASSVAVRLKIGWATRCSLQAAPVGLLPPIVVVPLPPPLHHSEASFDSNVPECAICMRGIAFACVGGSCTHHFCAACYLRWTATSHDCPTCRSPISCLCLDPEFDELCGGATRRPEDLRPFTASFRLERGQHAGITLRNNADGPGVVVEKVKKRDRAYQSGLRSGDTAVFLNGQSCRTHERTVELIEHAKGSGTTLSFVILPRASGAPILEIPPRGLASATSSTATATAPSPSLTAPPASASAATTASQGNDQAGGVLRLIGGVEWEQAETSSVVAYTLRFEDGSGPWSVTRRYSRWRALFEHVQARWPHALQSPEPLAFPPKAMPSYVLKASTAQTAERAAMLERFVRGVVNAAAHDAESGLAEWLRHWLRAQAEA
jgi:hypothetical protein